MHDLAHWLEALGMSEYAQRFAENDIDIEVLGDLNDADFDRLGVSIGHRRKLLKALAAGVATRAEAPHGKSATESAERRQVTVMFCDLVGSTALSARMDPEDLREVISAYQKSVAETVQRFGGFVAKYMGDGVLVYFGYPQAHEDDAERAVRAGLELIQAVSGLKSSAFLQTRVGIATGLVVVGDLIGSGAAQEQAVVGETPNVAARLQTTAEPNTVVIAESTRKLLGNLFDVEDLGAQDLKGIGGPVRAWAVLRPLSVESRFEALHASGLTELVGREEELELLVRRSLLWTSVLRSAVRAALDYILDDRERTLPVRSSKLGPDCCAQLLAGKLADAMVVRKAQHTVFLYEHIGHHLISDGNLDSVTWDALGDRTLDHHAALQKRPRRAFGTG
jgi:class 3 adenylate cyclase